MDMTEDNDLLLRQFFQQTAQQQIADNGFTERVMQHLPQHASLTARRTLLTRLWTAFCIVVFAVLFVAFHGWELLFMQVEVLVRTTFAEPPQVSPLMVVFALFSLLMIGAYEVFSYARLIR
jgi:hypothetical protein